jgi:hypothetical protein
MAAFGGRQRSVMSRSPRSATWQVSSVILFASQTPFVWAGNRSSPELRFTPLLTLTFESWLPRILAGSLRLIDGYLASGQNGLLGQHRRCIRVRSPVISSRQICGFKRIFHACGSPATNQHQQARSLSLLHDGPDNGTDNHR